ncbi:acyl-CoA dehydrogenase family protein [Heyndrickxia sporothermodurans]|uniref:Acyl-[acyl-carrier-protein] dehydrogenase MbtN n=1 Tax=Heyndrickxia sporothermodurans TaxID=46224 RepID=A0AB37HPW3_9BACI|nr:acyl-CoA dehydrogenase family protein [Heyndrickxia sporothermodurans]MBL5767242.1 acyl-CoA dehydrogenase family protein [Heyndrickxia sporothermodurans]MBL5770777.1 acyl-CoA dehydrogenase family protein [Heyndrickxia sporothermodurans]MBL5774408.1 acyl-CoA dehydrogenase family protein [Heyndrickxia sporothermodurans]MBL5777955.1 acyl-CoA dehydrogenase family protein [Heyndrickxia sporothermodurans]MBL5781533.1 acyl-CoA dehydrogenase family protein [Heyndrickxia sporothermodurans]
MNHLYLKDEHEIFRSSLRRFLQKECVPYYDEWEENRIVPRSFWQKMGEQGFLCPDVDESYGGYGGDWGFSVIINEELERVGSSLVGIGLHNDIVIPYLTSYGTEEQKRKWLPSCVAGETITAIAMTEPGCGSDLANMQTTAILDGDHYLLNGQKTFITNGVHADLVIVACKTNPQAVPPHKGMSLLAVERNTPGFSRGRKLNKVGLHAQDTAELIFEDCRVPKENLLGEEGKGFTYLMEKLQQERLIVAIAAQVSAERMLEITMDYVKSRKAFGKAISRFQNTQFKLVEMATDIEMGRAFLDQLIADHMGGKDIVTKVSMAKWKLTEMARNVATQCMQLHGGYGYMEEYEIARRYRDIPVASIYAGTNEIMKTIIAKNLGL